MKDFSFESVFINSNFFLPQGPFVVVFFSIFDSICAYLNLARIGYSNVRWNAKFFQFAQWQCHHEEKDDLCGKYSICVCASKVCEQKVLWKCPVCEILNLVFFWKRFTHNLPGIFYSTNFTETFTYSSRLFVLEQNCQLKVIRVVVCCCWLAKIRTY